MFRNWGFLLGEIWVLIALAALLGLFVGWLIWARRADATSGEDTAQLRADLERCRAMHTDKDDRIRALEAEISALRAAAAPVPVTEPAGVDYDGDGVVEGEDEGVKPATLAEARDGGADDLKRIKGIGVKLEQLCNRLGFYHFDQIAAWTDEEVAWVDANLEGFKGRVTRDDWVAQAKLLAAGGETEFSKKVDDGDVY
ncbi:MAG: hypothetical protein AAF762_11925 [Pseudomonadota bacterium]